jgi:hypothetical protein
MSALIIELGRVTLDNSHLRALRDEFEAGGILSGNFAVGDVGADPDQVYFLWHDSTEPPVSMLVDRGRVQDDAGTRSVARDFVSKWKARYK